MTTIGQNHPAMTRNNPLADIGQVTQIAQRVVEQIMDVVEAVRAQHEARMPDPAMPNVNGAGASASDPSIHTAKPGETMESIAAAKGMNVADLKRMNPQISNAPLAPGQQVIVGDAGDTEPAQPGSMSTFAPSTRAPASSGGVAGAVGGDAPATPMTNEVPAEASSGPLDLQDVFNRYTGGEYVYGGGRDGSGFGVPGQKNSDCSAFVSAVWKEKGLELPAHTDAAYKKLKSLGAETTTGNPKPGDVVFWMGAGTGGEISNHVGIYMGDGQVLQQTSSGSGGVQVLPMPKGGIEILRDPRLG